MGGGEEKKRKSGIGKEGDGVWERGRRELEKREKKTEKEKDRDWKRGRRRGKKSKMGFGKEGEEAGHRAAYSLKLEGTICLQFCCVINKKAIGTE